MDPEDDLAAVNELLGTQEPAVEPEPEPTPEPAPAAIAEPAVEPADQLALDPVAPADPVIPQDELLAMLQQASPQERAQILSDAREAALQSRVAQSVEPYRQELAARIEAGELSPETANELLESRTIAASAQLEREDARAQAEQVTRQAQMDAFFTQVTSEFPGADVEALRGLSGKLDANELRGLAERQSNHAKKLTETVIAKYVAQKTEDGGAFVPAGGTASKPSGGKVLDEDSSWTELLGL